SSVTPAKSTAFRNRTTRSTSSSASWSGSIHISESNGINLRRLKPRCRQVILIGRSNHRLMKQGSLKRELYAEFLGTLVLIAFGAGVVAQVVLSNKQNGEYLSINIAWGFAVTMGIYVAGGVSGAHLNPAVTLALAVRRDIPWSKVLPYSVAQIAGAFTGAAIAFLVYRAAFDNFDGGTRMVAGEKGTAGIFATYPQPYLSTTGALIDQIVGTA